MYILKLNECWKLMERDEEELSGYVWDLGGVAVIG